MYELSPENWAESENIGLENAKKLNLKFLQKPLNMVVHTSKTTKMLI